MLDVPTESKMDWCAAEVPDPFNPLGARGIGEPSQGAGCGAVECAIADALGDGYFNRTPIMSDMILTKLEGLPEAVNKLAAHS
jgi:CO/xanthine dehydrogenase Mo-binding subunit